MRLDKYLKVSRIIKRRTVANDACDAGRVTVNGKPAKAGQNVKAGDVLTLRFGEKQNSFRVLFVDEREAKTNASAMYEEV